jgi:hypothetical protein
MEGKWRFLIAVGFAICGLARVKVGICWRNSRGSSGNSAKAAGCILEMLALCGGFVGAEGAQLAYCCMYDSLKMRFSLTESQLKEVNAAARLTKLNSPTIITLRG